MTSVVVKLLQTRAIASITYIVALNRYEVGYYSKQKTYLYKMLFNNYISKHILLHTLLIFH